jgi:3-octaprenyl-4-hydroxybenzoate carboxy-lyase Rift-related domain
MKRSVPIPMEEVKSGEIHENVQEGNRVNLFDFPAPLLHEKDGGRYIGTGHLVITKDPDSDWINVGTYRIMLHDHNTAGIYIGPGKHASFPGKNILISACCLLASFSGSSTRRVNDGSMMRPYAILLKKVSSSLVSGRRIRLLLLHRQGR